MKNSTTAAPEEQRVHKQMCSHKGSRQLCFDSIQMGTTWKREIPFSVSILLRLDSIVRTTQRNSQYSYVGIDVVTPIANAARQSKKEALSDDTILKEEDYKCGE